MLDILLAPLILPDPLEMYTSIIPPPPPPVHQAFISKSHIDLMPNVLLTSIGDVIRYLQYFFYLPVDPRLAFFNFS